MIDLDKYFRIASNINDRVADFLVGNFEKKKDLIHDSDSHYTILEDGESNKIYETYLRLETPEAGFFTEENQENIENELVWVIDSIEGTSNYRSGNPFFATQIALVYKKNPMISIVNAPLLKQKFHAIKGRGSFLNNKVNKMSETVDMHKALLEIGRGTKDRDKDWFVQTLEKVIKEVRTFRVFGSTGLGLSYLAAGITDIYINSGSHVYDYVPGSLIVTEAGGAIFNLEGHYWDFGDEGIIASNEKLVEEIVQLIV